MALGATTEAQNDFRAALNMAYEGSWIPAALYALTGLAALELRQKVSPNILEFVCYILQHPASTQETKNLAAQLQVELTAKLSQAEIEGAYQRSALKSLDEYVHQFLVSFPAG